MPGCCLLKYCHGGVSDLEGQGKCKVNVSRDLTRMGWRWRTWHRLGHFMSGPGPSHCILHASISDCRGGGFSIPTRDYTKLISLLCLGNGSIFRGALLGSAKQALFRTRPWQEANAMRLLSLHLACCTGAVTADSESERQQANCLDEPLHHPPGEWLASGAET